jgi:hypothetical protein
MRELTRESVKQLYATLTQYYDAELIDHWEGNRETSMAVLTLYLGALGVKDVPYFLANCDINLDYEIYIPNEPGSENEAVLDQVLRCACVLQRVLNAQECDRPVEGNLLYMLSPTVRVQTEIQANRAAIEVYWWYSATRLKEPVMPLGMAQTLYSVLCTYGCSDLVIELADATRLIDEMLASVKSGEVKCQAAKDVIRFYGWDEVTVK